MKKGSVVQCVTDFKKLEKTYGFKYPEMGEILKVIKTEEHPNKECREKGILLLHFKDYPLLNTFGLSDIQVNGKPNFLPKFVRLNKSALRLVGNEYYRDGGMWSVGYKIIDGVLLSWYPNRGMKWLHRVPLIEITEKEWRDNNGEYAPKNINK